MMLTPDELLKSCNGIISGKYPEIKLYGKEVTDGYKKPSFFTDLHWDGYSYTSKNYAKASASFVITYFQTYPEEYDQLKKAAEIQEAFGICLKTGSRNFLIKEFTYDYIGEAQNILQMTVSFEWTEKLSREETGEPAESLELKMEKK